MVHMGTKHDTTPAHDLPRLSWLSVNPGDILVTMHGDKVHEREITRVEIDGAIVTYWVRERWSTEPVSWTTEAGWWPRIRRLVAR